MTYCTKILCIAKNTWQLSCVNIMYIRHMTYCTWLVLHAVTDLDVLPGCYFSADYAKPRVVKQYKGIYQIHESRVYPRDKTWFKKGDKSDKGNPVIDTIVSLGVNVCGIRMCVRRWLWSDLRVPLKDFYQLRNTAYTYVCTYVHMYVHCMYLIPYYVCKSLENLATYIIFATYKPNAQYYVRM